MLMRREEPQGSSVVTNRSRPSERPLSERLDENRRACPYLVIVDGL